MNEYVIATVVSLVISIIGFFLKRTMSRVDKHDSDVDNLKEITIKKTDYDVSMSELKKDIKKIKEDYTPQEVHTKDFDECKNDIKKIREDYIMKEDFYREINKVDRKLDYITDMMIKISNKGE